MSETKNGKLYAAIGKLRVHPIYPLILAGIILRMVILPTRPYLWGDEALTYSRVCGSFRDLLDHLRHDGFVPLHYEVYWLIGRFFRLDPRMMRLVPQLCGVAMIPAMYFLARQFVSRKAALLVAAFTTASAYMNVYSRDAKMYADFWLFCVLSTACYLWWLKNWDRPHTRAVAWLCWIAASLVMVGLHMPGIALLSLPPLFLLTQKRPHWRQGLLTIIGLLVIVAGPVGYYWGFNQLAERSDQISFEDAG
ncbi:MAG TPA: glycosyltransferase family 39 protein, partial [Tepidisphaeraceae bacterium]|nr:glycosyltransferase family 39 protein [Tepidisphaeraceae bacterium]